MKKLYSDIPPCPDPVSYILVRSREGSYWRKKRGMGSKGASLNEGFKVSSAGMAVTAPAAKRIVSKLKPYLDCLVTGRITVRISGQLRKQFNKTGKVDYTFLKDFDLQPNHPLENLLRLPFTVKVEDEVLRITIPIEAQTVKQNSGIISDFYFEVILISGDSTVENDLRIEGESSNTYPIKPLKQGDCTFHLPLIKNPWFAILKVCCIEGNEMAVAARNYGMKVIAVG